MTKVLDILKEELEIAMILSGIIQCIFYEESNAWGWGVGGTPLCVQQQRLQFLYSFGLKLDFDCLALK